jgi:hypothetical protein
MRGHPLEGARTTGRYSWSNSAHISDGELIQDHYGIDPLFVFDPTDRSNRPPPGDAMLTFWPIYPAFFQRLFLRSFTTGLVDASLSGRITGGVWRRALVRLADSTFECQCHAAVFFDPEDPEKQCWSCHEVPRLPPILEVGGHAIVLSDGAVVTSHHLRKDRRYEVVEASVESHPVAGQGWTLRNLGDKPWTITPLGEDPKAVPPGKRMAIRPMWVDFGPAQGTIRHDPVHHRRLQIADEQTR